MNILGYGLPLTITITLIYFNKLGVTDVFVCWVKSDKSSSTNIYIGLLIFYFPLYVCLIYTCGV